MYGSLLLPSLVTVRLPLGCHVCPFSVPIMYNNESIPRTLPCGQILPANTYLILKVADILGWLREAENDLVIRESLALC